MNMKKIIVIALGSIALIALIAAFWIMHILAKLPDVSVLKHYRPAAATEVLDRDGKLVTNYYDRKFRIWVPISQVPDIVIHAVVIAEDDTFFEHKGVNYKAAREALVHDLKKKRFARGGSTITQQMIKNVFLSKEKTISRKLREYVLAKRAEEVLTKHEILQIYLNEVEWGDDLYGIEAASRFYLDKHATELTPAEAALLAGMLPNPRYYNPYKRPDKARDRQERILFNMQQAKILTPEEYTAALAVPLNLRPENGGKLYLPGSNDGNHRPCYERALEHALILMPGESDLYRSGRTIKTTLDRALQIDLNRGNVPPPDKSTAMLDEVLVVKQGSEIRAFVCGIDKEREIREMLDSNVFLYHGYDVNKISVDSVSREQLIMPRENAGK